MKKNPARFPTLEAFLREAAENYAEHVLNHYERKSAELTKGE